ncbi:hypothetical protein ASPZODRAFT_56215 [Penicilliopsis zonata CBS 506.65]|uniref:BRCT domain-containing protein n=1 Tax=Penicilliopsis zonata CBS 506.65 TaxID=1073090 RepID=A0A1L9STW0_9EURO|nr:hypothetical protein ASPZODRAFT_56215 [Penicilliopsis zonata CBS 506.65]OJJ50554.1 hypothetical protein ASPZODRAFT_56215 [Penicilliopsis zonata CBS 506.65]
MQNAPPQPENQSWTARSLLRHAQHSHRRIPGLKHIPLRALGIILLVALVNILVWIAAAVVLAIDLMTRRLMATGQQPVTVGTFFSLGHSTIVIITSIVVAATAAAVSSRFGSFSTIGGIIGSSVSAVFLILLGCMNAYILYKLVKQMKKVLDLPEENADEAWKIEGGGLLFSILKRMFKLIDRPWKMYPLGVLFGLGFDTSSEIALLGISSIEAAKGTSFWAILIFPILFTAGMCLLDTTDGALMFSLYIQPGANFLPLEKLDSVVSTPATNQDNHIATIDQDNGAAATSRNHRDPIAFLYYSIVLTTLTVIVAIIIGTIQLLTMIDSVAQPTGKFWDGVETAGDYYDVIGGGICGCFVVFGTASVVVYKPWRRWIARRYGQKQTADEEHPPDDSLQGQAGDWQRWREHYYYGGIGPTGTARCLKTLPPIFILSTHLTLEELHGWEEKLVEHGARLTYDITEARLILGSVSQKKRAALELRSRGIWTQEIVIPLEQAGAEPPVKRRRVQQTPIAESEVIDLSTDSEGADDGLKRRPAEPRVQSRSSVGIPGSILLVATEMKDTVIVARLEWLERCLQSETLLALDPFVVYQARITTRPAERNPPKLPGKDADAHKVMQRAKQDMAMNPPVSRPRHGPGGDASRRVPPKLHRETTSEHEETIPIPPAPDWVKNHVLYACMRSAPLHPPNEKFIDQLIRIRTARALALDEIGVRAYSTSIASIAAYPYEVRTPAEILALPGCDVKIAHLFSEFKHSPTGTLAAAQALDTDPTLRILHTFYQIWGVGAKTARDFYYARHWRDLDDVVAHGWASLSRVQQIGVKYYDEFQAGIPRVEVERIAQIILRHAQAVRPESRYDGRGIDAVLVGGYRRGKELCGDVDLVLSHRDEAVTRDLVVDVVASLEAEGWITHTLALHLTTSHRDQQTLPFRGDDGGKPHFDTLDKALVVWQDPHYNQGEEEEQQQEQRRKNPNPHRRVDIIISPWRTVGCAVLGWSGDTTFERDLRRYAKKRHGWKFDSSGVRERTSGGRVLDLERAGRTWEERERLVMEGLGVGWRPATERCTR